MSSGLVEDAVLEATNDELAYHELDLNFFVPEYCRLCVCRIASGVSGFTHVVSYTVICRKM